jgi:Tol biopolymer transport system component
MTRRGISILIVGVALPALLAAGGYRFLCRPKPDVGKAVHAGKAPKLWPDYTGVTIPPNIAPMNFVIHEPGDEHYVRIRCDGSEPIEVWGDGMKVVIPPEPWHRLLAANKGKQLYLDVFVRSSDGRWSGFTPAVNTVAAEETDGYLAYRLISPIHNFWRDVGIYQRNLEGFDEAAILHNSTFDKGCVNCHTFHKNDPRKVAVNVRPGTHGDPPGGLLLIDRGEPWKVVDTKTAFNPIPAIYLAWHPDGQVLAFSSNKIIQFFHCVGENRDVFDYHSDLALYRVSDDTVTTSPRISRPDRMETYPEWSPDGKYLYFCTAPQLVLEQYEQVRYDLARIGYDVNSDAWGDVETLISASDSHRSVTHPKISPDGRWLMFCMCDHGNFSIYRPESDLYLMDLRTGQYRRLEINSDRCESWHCWSTNSRWVVFSSKVEDGLFARPYISYVDAGGKVHKPVLMPQEDPEFYDTFLKTYNVPQFVTGPVAATPRQLADLLHDKARQVSAKLDEDVQVAGPSGTAEDNQYEPNVGG